MTASRYWRLTGLAAGNAPLSLRHVQLWAGGVRVDPGASITATLPPVAGSVDALLSDGNSNECVFGAIAANAPGFAIVITLASAVEVDEIFLDGARLPPRAAAYATDADSGFDGYAEADVTGAWYAAFARDIKTVFGAQPDWAMFPGEPALVDRVGSLNGTRTGGAVVNRTFGVGVRAAFDPQTSGLIKVANAGALDSSDFTVVVDATWTVKDNLVICEHGSDNKGWSIQSFGSVGPTGGVPGGVWCNVGNTGTVGYPVGFRSFGAYAAFNDGYRHRVALRVARGGGAALFIDRIKRNEYFDSNTTPSFNDNALSIGSRNGVAGLPAGSAISLVALFSRALSDAEIAQLTSTVPARTSRSRTARLPALVQPTAPGGMTIARAQVVDIEFGGDGGISGSVEIQATPNNVPVARRVRLRRSRDGAAVRETWSAPDGAYAFANISRRYRYDVEAWDHTGKYTSVIGNNVTPKPMPGAAP